MIAVIFILILAIFLAWACEDVIGRAITISLAAVAAMALINGAVYESEVGFTLAEVEYQNATAIEESLNAKPAQGKMYTYVDTKGNTIVVSIDEENVKEVTGIDSPQILKRELKCTNWLAKAILIEEYQEKIEYKLLIPKKNSLK